MEPSDFPFQQKRFFDEYQAWTAVERVLPDLANILQLPAKAILQLAAPKSENAGAANHAHDVRDAAPATCADIVKPFSPPRKVFEPLTSEQLRDRSREMLRQEIEALNAQRARFGRSPQNDCAGQCRS
jgi:hypothetical protein